MEAEPSSYLICCYYVGFSSLYSHLKQDKQLIIWSVLTYKEKQTSAHELLLPKISPGNIWQKDLYKLQINGILTNRRKKAGHVADVLKRVRQEDDEFQANQGYRVSHISNT